MKYTDEQVKVLALSALEEYGYHDARWGETGSKDSRENKCYYNGRADTLIEILGEPGFSTSKEAYDAYDAGVTRYEEED